MRYPKGLLKGLALSSLLGLPAAASAEVDVDFAGFASFVYAKTITSERDESFFSGISDEGEYRDFNKLGFRVDADLDNHLTFAAQILAEGKKDYDPEFDWIYLNYQFNPEWSLTVGRSRVPVFMYSDFLDVSYAYPWIAPPISVYNLEQTPFKSFEGIKVTYNTDINDWTSELIMYTGGTEDEFKEQGTDTIVTIRDMIGVSWTLNYDWLTFRAFYLGGNTTLDLTTNANIHGLIYGLSDSTPVDTDNLTSELLDDVLAGNTGTPAIDFNTTLQLEGTIEAVEAWIAAESSTIDEPVDLQEDLLWVDDKGEFYGLGLVMDWGDYYLISELNRITVEHNIATPDLRSFYLTVGTRLPDNWQLAFTWGVDRDYTQREVWQQIEQYVPAIDSPGTFGAATPAIQGALLSIQDGLREQTENLQNYEINNYTLSARWDFHRSASFKMEYIYHQNETNGTGQFDPRAIRIGFDLVF